MNGDLGALALRGPRAEVALRAPFVKNRDVMAAADEVGLFEEKRPFASSAVWACAVYSLVPFVGVVFLPFIFVFGIAAVLRGDAGNRQAALRAMAAGVGILVVQLVLWGLLYAVPKWGLANQGVFV